MTRHNSIYDCVHEGQHLPLRTTAPPIRTDEALPCCGFCGRRMILNREAMLLRCPGCGAQASLSEKQLNSPITFIR